MEEGVKSVERALQILERVSLAKNGIGVTELAKELNMYKSTIHRVLATLTHLGYIEQDPETERYKLGYKLLEVSSRLLNNLDIRREAMPYLQELTDLTNEVVHLVVLNKGQVVYIEKVEGTETIRMHSRVGNRAPVHCTGVGKAILAYLPEAQVREIIRQYGLEPHTPKTLSTLEDLLQDLQQIRERGYALDDEENELGITCVAAPIFDHTGSVAASISVSAPTIRMQPQRIEQLAQQVRKIGLKISARLGYRGTL
ncbi:IclR family transcriptional regulator [Effusibacillus lacus]|uniref:Glycerol operon regulatory protein n=1 Tax=Effusibacillus lacus TaxID=1348429 RepID=A0A292YJF9_9BACL|nr:IclR family transcriptional regulator [Effusibacillus lacus]TCS75086.1 IclR family transcriptional regulator [Effusibacillus lacus]GAX89039.1 IclR family transcriptional regulator [Effusibacillus lacus]